jgi:hypothetical protein
VIIGNADALLQNMLWCYLLYFLEQGIIIFVGNVYAEFCFYGQVQDALVGFAEIRLNVFLDLLFVPLRKVVKIAAGKVNA